MRSAVAFPISRERRRRALSLDLRANRLAANGKDLEAWRLVRESLDVDAAAPHANVLAGDQLLWSWECLGLAGYSGELAAREALPYYRRALAVQPGNADAYSGQTAALLEIGELEAAVTSARESLAVLDARIGAQMDDPEVYRLVAEEVYSNAVKALAAAGEMEEARVALARGLAEFPGCPFLERPYERVGLPASTDDEAALTTAGKPAILANDESGGTSDDH